MTLDYESDATGAEVSRSMQSPYTRAEFIAREVELGIEAQGIPGADFHDLDPYAERGIRERAEWNAQAAERAGIVWRQEPKAESRPQRPPIIAEIRDPSGVRVLYHALEERVKDEIRKLIQEEISAFDRQSITPRLKNVNSRTESAIESADQGHRRLQTHDGRITSIEKRENSYVQAVGELSARINRELGEDDPNDECETVIERLDDLETRIQALDRYRERETKYRSLLPGHDDLAYALGRAYLVLEGLEPSAPDVIAQEMEAIRTVLGNNWRDWLRPRSRS